MKAQKTQPLLLNQTGTTLLELAIAIAIASIVAGVTMYAGYSYITTAKQERSMDEVESIAETAELFMMSNAKVPQYGDLEPLYPAGKFTNYSGILVPHNAFGGRIRLGDQSDKMITVTTSLPAGTGATMPMGVATSGMGNLPITGTSQRILSRGIADEAFWSKRQVFGNHSSFY